MNIQEYEKLNASLLLICKLLGGECDKYKMLKILYFAEKSHLAKYGRPITSEKYVALEHGPVPSVSYDNVKSDSDSFKIIDSYTIKAINEPDMDEFSESDIECITLSVNENRDLSFRELKSKSHDDAYNKTMLNGIISHLKMAEAAGASKNMLEYINLIVENNNCLLDAPSEIR